MLVATLTIVPEPSAVELSRQAPVSHDAGVADRELLVNDVRWALVEYGAGRARTGWCDTPHCGYVVAGAVRYDFEDGRDSLLVRIGSGFVLPAQPAHRGCNNGSEPARLFIIDALPERPPPR